jgi:hypothetical protein
VMEELTALFIKCYNLKYWFIVSSFQHGSLSVFVLLPLSH